MPAIVAAEVQSRNPLGQTSSRFRDVFHPRYTRRQDVAIAHRQEPGTIRRWWRALAGYTGGPPPFSWTRNGFAPEPRVGAAVTTPEFFALTTTNVLTVGNQLSNPMLRPIVKPRVQYPPAPLTWVGNRQGRPGVRQRIASLGSRVPPLNAGALLPPGDLEQPAAGS